MKERVLKKSVRKVGNGHYHQEVVSLGLGKKGDIKTEIVARLVAKTFLPNPDNLPEVNHKDENPLNNQLSNLEWCDGLYNKNYGTRNEKISKVLKNGPCSKPVLQFDLNKNLLMEHPSTIEIERLYGYKHSAIGRCCRGGRPTAYGYIWRFKNDE